MRSLLVLILLTCSTYSYSQIINFPDPKFKNALVNTKCVDTDGNGFGDADADLNNDGEIELNEVSNIDKLFISNQNIVSLEGIDNFSILTVLNCSRNKLLHLNLENFAKLLKLDCSNNAILTLNLNGCSTLKEINCSYNKIELFESIGIDSLNNLACNSNNLKKLDVSKNFALENLDCTYNKLTSLNVSNLTKIEKLSCSHNLLDSLQLHNNTNLIKLSCINNKLKSLILDGFINLEDVYCSYNEINEITIENVPNLKNLFCTNNKIVKLHAKNILDLSNLDLNNNLLNEVDLSGSFIKTFNCSHNKLSSLDLSNVKKLIYLGCNNNVLSNLNISGIDSLKSVDCSSNKLTVIDAFNLRNLDFLWCLNNQISMINIDKCFKLTTFSCSSNKIENLNLSDNLLLNTLDCSNNLIKNLDISNLSNLGNLNCSNNQIKNLEVSKLYKLSQLHCLRNEIELLDVSRLNELKTLRCSFNKIKTLDISSSKYLSDVDCSNNNLEYIFIKNGINNNTIFANNLNLTYICCDEIETNSIKSKLINYGLNNVEFNTYCTFTPGEKFYIISGKSTFDKWKNGCDELDVKLVNVKYKIKKGLVEDFFISNTGQYFIPIVAGTHTITPTLENANHFEVTPPLFTVTFPSTSDTFTQDFCITPKGVYRQTNITVIPLTPPARPGFNAQYKIVWENAGNQIESGTLNFTYDESRLDYIEASQMADVVADGIVKWNFSDLRPFEKREIIVTLKINRPTDTPAVNAGDKLYLNASILDNIFTLENTVVGSYDPNDKTCLQGDRVKPDMVGEYVDYLIRFENTGNFAAENVVVKDIIDTKTFDISTLKITDASHEVYTRIEGNKVEFIFENIQLPFDDANNDGYIAFKIKTLPTLVLGDSLKNLADIYFDYNFPIRTNEALTTVAFPVFTKDITTEVHIYPNPVTDILYLDTKDHWTKADIYDIAGRIIRSISLDVQSINVSGLESGTYFIRLQDGDSVGLVKFVKI